MNRRKWFKPEGERELTFGAALLVRLIGIFKEQLPITPTSHGALCGAARANVQTAFGGILCW